MPEKTVTTNMTQVLLDELKTCRDALMEILFIHDDVAEMRATAAKALDSIRKEST